MKKFTFLSVFLVVFLFGTTSAFAETSFTDVGADYWAEQEIQYLHGLDVINGYDNNEFKPNNSVTRAQAAIMIVRALNLSTENRPAPSFTDISAGFHAYDYVATVADAGIIGGRNGKFLPNELLTRGQMAAILDRAFELELATSITDFKDIDEDYIFYDNIQTIAHNRVTMGYEVDRTYRPNAPTTRAQFSVFLARVLDEGFRPETPAIPNADYFEALIYEAEDAIIDAMVPEFENFIYYKEPLSPFEEIKPVFTTYYTEEITNDVWKTFYEEHMISWGYELSQAFPYDMENVELSIEGSNHVILSGYEPANEISNESYYNYKLVRTNGEWFIDDMY